MVQYRNPPSVTVGVDRRLLRPLAEVSTLLSPPVNIKISRGRPTIQ